MVNTICWMMSFLIFVFIASPSVLAITEAQKKDKIVEVLFNLKSGDADKVTYHDYNDYGEAAHLHNGCNGYEGGHSGWDVQTKNVAGDVPTVDEPFYSLTAGEVIRSEESALNTIAVYSRDDDKTTLYLHARRIDVSKTSVKVGDRLGIQGNTGLSDNPRDREHVHIEVRTGRARSPSCGAGATTPPINIDPIDYLYESVTASSVQSTDVSSDGVDISDTNLRSAIENAP